MITNAVITWIRDACLGLLDFLYPSGCVECGIIGEGYLCGACVKKIIYIDEPFCKHCGIHLDSDNKNFCPKCEFDFGFHDGGISIALYEKPLSTLIHRLKYQKEIGIAKLISRLALSRLVSSQQIDSLKSDLIHPVPLFSKRQSARGFNQSALIAGAIASETGMHYADNLLKRVRDTKSQTGLTYDERAMNVQNAFAVRNDVDLNGRSVLLVDDVMTTGATIQECARALKNAGAGTVKFITVARQLLE